MNTFKMEDGRSVSVDWTSDKSVSSLSKPDMIEIRFQLNEDLRIICSQLNGSQVYELFNKRH